MRADTFDEWAFPGRVRGFAMAHLGPFTRRVPAGVPARAPNRNFLNGRVRISECDAREPRQPSCASSCNPA